MKAIVEQQISLTFYDDCYGCKTTCSFMLTTNVPNQVEVGFWCNCGNHWTHTVEIDLTCEINAHTYDVRLKPDHQSLTSINPATLKDFVKHIGWQQVIETTKDGEYLFTHPKTPRQIYFPMNREVTDYNESVWVTIEKLAAFDSVSTTEMLHKIEKWVDTIEGKDSLKPNNS